MFWNGSLIEIIVSERLAAARAAAAEERMVRALRPPRPSLRAMVGARLVALGERLIDRPRTGTPEATRTRRQAASRWEAAGG